jgi:hypothetical protein
MGGHSEGHPIVFRNWLFIAFGWAALALTAVAFGLAAASIGGGGTFIGAAAVAFGGYLIWLIGCHSAVRMDRSGLTLDDVLTRHVIPWQELRGIEVVGGLVFEVRGGPYIRMMMYGGSLWGVVTRYRQQRKVAARMNTARERLQASQVSPEPAARYAKASTFSAWPPLLIFAAMEVIAAVGVLAR